MLHPLPSGTLDHFQDRAATCCGGASGEKWCATRRFVGFRDGAFCSERIRGIPAKNTPLLRIPPLKCPKYFLRGGYSYDVKSGRRPDFFGFHKGPPFVGFYVLRIPPLNCPKYFLTGVFLAGIPLIPRYSLGIHV